jgi:hypothetical protein
MHHPSANQHCRAPQQERHVPVDPLRARYRFVDVVNSEDLVIDDAFHEVNIPKPIRIVAISVFAGRRT